MTTNETSPDDYVANAHVALSRIRNAGFDAELKHYPSDSWDELDRYYVIVQHEGSQYQTQYHQNRVDGFGFETNASGPFWDKAVAKRLNAIAGGR